MALADILASTETPSKHLLDVLGTEHQGRKIGLSEERVEPLKPLLRQYIAYWRAYPDLFVDFMQTGGDPNAKKTLNFFFYQRIYLRAVMRYKYVYCVFPRAYSKSFLAVLTLMIKCVLYPRSKLFVTSGGKEQAASIIKEKVQEICTMVPAFNREISRRPGTTMEGKDYVRYVFKNGSYFDNVAASERSRGGRRHGGVIEECVGVDGKLLMEVILPMMNVDRRCMDGSMHTEEPLNKSQLYITTAGYKGTFSYNKLIQLLVWMVTDPTKAFIMGGTWRTPVLAGLQNADFITDMKRDGTFDPTSFNREYESRWSGTSDGAFFDGEVIDKCRVLNRVELEAANTKGGAYYVISADIGRKGDLSAVMVFKVIPQPIGPALKRLVNIESLENMHFEDQAIALKKFYYKYKARRLVIDGNGIGQGLIDYMVKPQYIEETDERLPPFGIYNDDKGDYKKYQTKDTEYGAIYLIMANYMLNTDAHSNVQVQLNSGKLRLLIDERTASQKLMATKVGQAMTPEARADYLKPYKLTSILKDEILNLREETAGINIKLKQANKAIRKDKFSALEYGLYYIKFEEDNKRKKKRFNAADWARLFN